MRRVVLAWRRLRQWWPPRRDHHEREQRDREVHEKKRQTVTKIDRLARSLEDYDRAMRE